MARITLFEGDVNVAGVNSKSDEAVICDLLLAASGRGYSTRRSNLRQIMAHAFTSLLGIGPHVGRIVETVLSVNIPSDVASVLVMTLGNRVAHCLKTIVNVVL